MKTLKEEISYKITVTPWRRWQGDYTWNYSEDSDNEYELSHNSIEELYESIADDYNRWIVKIEIGSNCSNCSDYERVENNGIKYSPIYIEVEPYSEEKRNATENYKKIGEVRDKALSDKKDAEDKEKIRAEKWRKDEKDKQDLREFERLKRKFNQ